MTKKNKQAFAPFSSFFLFLPIYLLLLTSFPTQAGLPPQKEDLTPRRLAKPPTLGFGAYFGERGLILEIGTYLKHYGLGRATHVRGREGFRPLLRTPTISPSVIVTAHACVLDSGGAMSLAQPHRRSHGARKRAQLRRRAPRLAACPITRTYTHTHTHTHTNRHHIPQGRHHTGPATLQEFTTAPMDEATCPLALTRLTWGPPSPGPRHLGAHSWSSGLHP
jgi:hypothetical protein